MELNSGYIFKLSALHYFWWIYAWDEINGLLNAGNFHLFLLRHDKKKESFHADIFFIINLTTCNLCTHISVLFNRVAIDMFLMHMENFAVFQKT